MTDTNKAKKIPVKKRNRKAPDGLRDQIAIEAMKAIIQGATKAYERTNDDGFVKLVHSSPAALDISIASVTYADTLLMELGYDL